MNYFLGHFWCKWWRLKQNLAGYTAELCKKFGDFCTWSGTTRCFRIDPNIIFLSSVAANLSAIITTTTIIHLFNHYNSKWKKKTHTHTRSVLYIIDVVFLRNSDFQGFKRHWIYCLVEICFCVWSVYDVMSRQTMQTKAKRLQCTCTRCVTAR